MIVIRDDTGKELLEDSFGVSIGGHVSFVLPTQFPLTANRRGNVELSQIPGQRFLTGPAPVRTGQIGVLGMRFTPPNNALTTIHRWLMSALAAAAWLILLLATVGKLHLCWSIRVRARRRFS